MSRNDSKNSKTYKLIPVKSVLLVKLVGVEKMSKTETVEVTLKLPKQIIEFIKDSWSTDNLEETLTKEIVDISYSQVEVEANEKGIFPEELMSKYGLLPIFRKYGVLPSYIKESEKKMNGELEVTVKLPREIVEFLQKYTAFIGQTLNDFFKGAMINEVKNMLQSEDIFETPWSTTEQVIKAHSLEKYLTDKEEAKTQ